MAREQNLDVLQIQFQYNQNRNHYAPQVVFYYEDNLSKSFRRLPEIPFCFSLKIRPSCRTLSKALEISRKSARTFRELRSSKAWWISSTRNNSWLIVESPERKPGYKIVGIKVRIKIAKNNIFKKFTTDWK